MAPGTPIYTTATTTTIEDEMECRRVSFPFTSLFFLLLFYP